MTPAAPITLPAAVPAGSARDRLVLAVGRAGGPDGDPGPVYAPIVLIRPARPADAPDVAALLEDFAARGLLLPRNRAEVVRHIREFVVAVDPSGIVGCAGLRIHSPGLAEVIGLAVAERCHGRGIGRHLVEALVGDADGLGIHRVFALTLQVEFFAKLGFATAPIAEFPEKIERDCAGCARRATCTEIAVVRVLHGHPA